MLTSQYSKYSFSTSLHVANAGRGQNSEARRRSQSPHASHGDNQLVFLIIYGSDNTIVPLIASLLISEITLGA